MMTDPASFDFEKWEKCMTEVLDQTPELLLTESDKQGEPALRAEIADYLYRSRGVVCNQNQVIISAGAQQLFNHLARILKLMGIEHVCTEEPGYTPVRSILERLGIQHQQYPGKGRWTCHRKAADKHPDGGICVSAQSVPDRGGHADQQPVSAPRLG